MASPDCRTIKQAVEGLLAQPEFNAILQATGITVTTVDIPENPNGVIIDKDVFAKVDIADLVIVNISPEKISAIRRDTDVFSPNVFYELGLVHSLGIPYLLLGQEAQRIPFYQQNIKINRVKELTVPEVQDAIRAPLANFLGGEGDVTRNFAKNPISEFYGNQPVVNISAVAGIAAGYYDNMVRRALTDDGFIVSYPKELRHLIVCHPPNVITETQTADLAKLRTLLEENGFVMRQKTLPMDKPSQKRALVGDFVGDVLIDLPTNVYSLMNSPRFRCLRDRVRGNTTREQILLRASENLVKHFEDGVLYHVELQPEIRVNALSFCPFRDIPAKLRELGVVPIRTGAPGEDNDH